MEHFSTNVDEGQANLAMQVLPSIEKTNLSPHNTIDSGTMIGTVNSKWKTNLSDEERRAVERLIQVSF